MAAIIVKKTHKKRDKKTGEMVTKTKSYHAEPDYKPETVDDICIEFIANYCKANKQKEWFLETVNQKEIANIKKRDENGKVVKDENGEPVIVDTKEQDISFVSIRSAFVDKFFPDIRKVEEEKATIKTRFGADFWND